MNPCGMPEQRLHAWLDGEAGTDTAAVQEHVDGCRACAGKLAALRQGQRVLVEMIDQGVGDVEPLLALQGIRRHMQAHEERGFFAELRERVADAWMFNRRAVLGLGVAAAVGALCAPWVVWLAGRLAASHGIAAVVVESLQVQDNLRAHVVPQGDSSTTLIWVEPAPTLDGNGNGHGRGAEHD